MTEKHINKHTVKNILEEVYETEVARDEDWQDSAKAKEDSAIESELNEGGTDCKGESPVKEKNHGRKPSNETFLHYLTIIIIVTITLLLCPFIAPEILKILWA